VIVLPDLISHFLILTNPRSAPDPVHIYTTEATTGLAWLTVSSTLKLSGNFTIHAGTHRQLQ
jgi:hypothetical protein